MAQGLGIPVQIALFAMGDLKLYRVFLFRETTLSNKREVN